MRTDIPFLIWFVLIPCMTSMTGCAAGPAGVERAEGDTGVTLITDRGPTYPPNMQKQGQAGFVSMDCTITRDGQARDCIIIKATNAEFSDAAKTYIADARYQPAMRDGMPVAVNHHIIAINFKFPPQRLRLIYDCPITAAGHAEDCRRETSSDAVPAMLENIVLDKLRSLPLTIEKELGGTGKGHHRVIEVLMSTQLDPEYDFSPPILPVQKQMDLVLACKGYGPSRCKEVSGLPASTESHLYKDEGFTALSIGFNGVLPTQDEVRY